MELDSFEQYSRCFPSDKVCLFVPILTVGVCTLDADVCVCEDGETGGGAAGRKTSPTGKREREKERVWSREVHAALITKVSHRCAANKMLFKTT